MDEEIEKSGFRLIGVSGLEDLLQEDLELCIGDFLEGGMRFWMLTGDKGETTIVKITCFRRREK